MDEGRDPQPVVQRMSAQAGVQKMQFVIGKYLMLASKMRPR